MYLYLTADSIGTPTGGGVVTWNESEALKSLGECEIWSRKQLETDGEEPWKWDQRGLKSLDQFDMGSFAGKVKLCHVYSGTFSESVKKLKGNGTKVCYTIAAHDREVSRREHERLGIPFQYPHLVQEDLWERYIEGYRLADIIICPSTVAAQTVRNYGPDFADKRIEVIPHGVDLPGRVASLPRRWTVGYLGSYGADKGVIYLLQAWAKLAYKDATLVLAGRDSVSMGPLVKQLRLANVHLMGWAGNVSDFYNSISLYVQPSATEGFGIEVLEALAHGRPVLCSKGAGAQDMVSEWYRFPACDAEGLAGKIDTVKIRGGCVGMGYPDWEGIAEQYTWDKIRQRYIDVWRSLL